MSGDEKGGIQWPPWPSYSAQEIAAATSVFESGAVNYWTGQQGRRFEQEFAQFIGVPHGVAIANGSLALGIAIRSLGLPRDAEVIVTPRTFVASISEIILAGARPVFAEVDRDSQNITASSIEAVISPRTAAVMTVHLAGWPCDMPGILEVTRAHGIPTIEDCAQAHGAAIDGKRVGSWGKVAAFSFCQDKIMSTGGEGGMIVCRDEKVFRACWSFKDHGKSPDLLSASKSSSNQFRWLHESVGTNARLTEPQSAIGLEQLSMLPGWVETRQRNADRLSALLAEVPSIRLAIPPDDIRHAYYKYYFFVRPECLKSAWSRDRILSELGSLGIPCGSGICPEVYRERGIQQILGDAIVELPRARELGETSIMLPVHPTMDEADMERMAGAIIDVFSVATR